ncbi:MAG: hypothetical protein ACRDRL_20920 [Sciscionella sp.]
MPLKKLIAILAAIGLCTLGVVLLFWPSASSSDGKSSASVNRVDTNAAAYAYTTERELVVMRGDRVLTRVSRLFDEADSAHNKVIWTQSGDYIALLSDTTLLQEDSSQITLITVNTHTGAQKRMACPYCADIIAVDANSVLAAKDIPGDYSGATVRRFDLDRPGSSVPVNLSLEGDNLFTGSFLISTRSYILTNKYVTSSGSSGEEELELLKSDNSTKNWLGGYDANDYLPAAAAENPRGGGERFAVAIRDKPGICATDFPILVFDATGISVVTDMSAAEPPGYVKDTQGGMDVNDLWWGLDGHLHATITSWTCDKTKDSEAAKKILAHPSTLWRLDGTKWSMERSSPATMVRQLDTTSEIVLVIPDCIGVATFDKGQVYCHTGNLYRDQAGKRTLVAANVISISTPPVHVAPILVMPSPYWVQSG